MSGDHHLRGAGGRRLFQPALDHAGASQPVTDDRIMHQFAEDGQGALLGEALGFGDGVADTKTKAVMFSELNDHQWSGWVYTLYGKGRMEKKGLSVAPSAQSVRALPDS